MYEPTDPDVVEGTVPTSGVEAEEPSGLAEAALVDEPYVDTDLDDEDGTAPEETEGS